jgi:glycosyltransferase involved in cell wall biosynthesis
MRILQVINRLDFGGAQSLLAQWATCLQCTEHHIDVCVLYSKGQFAQQLEDQGIKVYNLTLAPASESYHPPNKYDLRMVSRLARVVREGNYDIVHAHLFPTSLFVALTSFLIPEPCYIVSEHNVFNRRRRFQFFKVLDAFIYQRYAQIVAVSSSVRKALLEWLPRLDNKVQVIVNAVDPGCFQADDVQLDQLRQELGINKDNKIIFYAGRLVPAKGIDILLEAFSNLARKDSSVKILLAGDGPLKDILQKQTASLDLEKNVQFLGLRTDISQLLNIADIIVLPSRWEGLPMILLEAMAARKPILATRVGGIPEIIEHGKSGWLVPPENQQALAEAIALLLSSKELCQQLSDGALEKVSAQYSIKPIIQQLLESYEKVLSTQKNHAF